MLELVVVVVNVLFLVLVFMGFEILFYLEKVFSEIRIVLVRGKVLVELLLVYCLEF